MGLKTYLFWEGHSKKISVMPSTTEVNVFMDKVFSQIAFLLLGFGGSTISDEQYTYQVGVHT